MAYESMTQIDWLYMTTYRSKNITSGRVVRSGIPVLTSDSPRGPSPLVTIMPHIPFSWPVEINLYPYVLVVGLLIARKSRDSKKKKGCQIAANVVLTAEGTLYHIREYLDSPSLECSNSALLQL